ncbi:GroES-like protein [Neolentinus lepideus HHB14362 ss-1]|uniref:GroES-like protein n=1 Tax=Neolentinus lepideus HHB14362 ss-1 TaxID=1314782 RepID=A0A165UKY1_9AGAM|nr:GroES-like protein [Neolentinus lepideus HHB14362 ss-1]
MAPPEQKALFLVSKHGTFSLGTKAVPAPKAGELLVKVETASLNPIDWKVQKYGGFIETYPAILGTGLSGTVEEVGEAVTSFSKGDKVVSIGSWTNDSNAFQQYALIAATFAAKLPPSTSFDEGATLPNGTVTAALALYGTPNPTAPGGIGLTAPWDGGRGKYAGKPILVFGGASSVGQYVIQFAKLSGFSPIITTASPSSEALLKSLGATHIVNRKLPPADIKSAISSFITSPLELIYDAISISDTQQVAYDLLAPGGTLVLTLPATVEVDESKDQRIFQVQGLVQVPSHRKVGTRLYVELPKLLASGDIKPNPVKVLPNGLEGIVEGLKELERGVSGVKLVAKPQETA